MKILSRYIAKVIVTYVALVVLVVMGLDFFISLLTDLRDVGTGDYGFWQAVLHTVLRLPYNLYQFSPMLILLGGLIGLGLLASHQELVVMRASGISLRQLLGAVSVAALILIALAMLLGEFVGPQANYAATQHKESAENGGQAVATASGVWVHEGDNFLHIERVVGRDRLEGVTRYEFDMQHRLLASYHVKAMEFDNGQWNLHQIVKTTFKNDRTSSQRITHGNWDLVLNPNLLNVGLIEPDEMSLRHLSKYTAHLVKNRQQATNFQFEFWKRIFQPLATLVMLLLAIPFVLNNSRTVTMGRRMLFGVMAGFAFYILNAFLGQLSVVYQLSPMVAAILPTFIFALLGYAMIRYAAS